MKQILAFFFLLIALSASAQVTKVTKTPNWMLLDFKADTIYVIENDQQTGQFEVILHNKVNGNDWYRTVKGFYNKQNHSSEIKITRAETSANVSQRLEALKALKQFRIARDSVRIKAANEMLQIISTQPDTLQ
jgi:opacity protein-like surface antigen